MSRRRDSSDQIRFSLIRVSPMSKKTARIQSLYGTQSFLQIAEILELFEIFRLRDAHRVDHGQFIIFGSDQKHSVGDTIRHMPPDLDQLVIFLTPKESLPIRSLQLI